VSFEPECLELVEVADEALQLIGPGQKAPRAGGRERLVRRAGSGLGIPQAIRTAQVL